MCTSMIIYGLKMSKLISFKEESHQMPILQYSKPGASNTIQHIVNGHIPIFTYCNILLQSYYQYWLLYCAMICLPSKNMAVCNYLKMRNILNEKDRFCWEVTHVFMEICQRLNLDSERILLFITSDKWFQSCLMTERFAPTTFGHDRFS